MAGTEAECGQMVHVYRKQGVKLMIAYRLHFEKANLTAVDLVKSGRLGEPRMFNSTFTMQVRDAENIRLRRETARWGPVRHRRPLHQCRALSLPG